MTTLADVWDQIPTMGPGDPLHTSTCVFPSALVQALTTAQDHYDPIYARLSVQDGACAFDLMLEMHPATRTGMYAPDLTAWMVAHGAEITVAPAP
jgi:hypothetical protein